MPRTARHPTLAGEGVFFFPDQVFIPYYFIYRGNQKKFIFFKKSCDFIFFWPRGFLILLLQYDFDRRE